LTDTVVGSLDSQRRSGPAPKRLVRSIRNVNQVIPKEIVDERFSKSGLGSVGLHNIPDRRSTWPGPQTDRYSANVRSMEEE
jgi:hypothetical protein